MKKNIALLLIVATAMAMSIGCKPGEQPEITNHSLSTESEMEDGGNSLKEVGADTEATLEESSSEKSNTGEDSESL